MAEVAVVGSAAIAGAAVASAVANCAPPPPWLVGLELKKVGTGTAK